jgi:hypothetical protein
MELIVKNTNQPVLVMLMHPTAQKLQKDYVFGNQLQLLPA